MNHDIYVIDQDPLLGLAAFMLVRKFTGFIFYIFFYKIGYCAKLVRIACFADDEKISNSFGDLAEVKAGNILTFFFLDRVDD